MNLQDLLELERPLLLFDCETTGPNPDTDRIVELGFQILEPNQVGPPFEWSTLFNPEMPIPYEATHGNPDKGYEGHGITDEMVTGCKRCGLPANQHSPDGTTCAFQAWPRFRDIADNLLIGFKNKDYGGYNEKRFDLPLMQAEFKRAGHTWSYADAKILDGYRLWQLVQGRTLSDAVEWFLKRKHCGAHRTLGDVSESIAVITEQLRANPHLPRRLTQLHELCWPTDPNAIDPDGKIVWKDGRAVMNFGKHQGVAMTSVPRSYFTWVVGPKAEKISEEVKQICRDALAGKFPEQPALKEVE